MNCKEFKENFEGKIILTFLMEDFTFIYKFKCEHITFFMKKFLDRHHPKWKVAYFYDVGTYEGELSLDKIKEQAKFLYLIARNTTQSAECVFKSVFAAPDFSHLEGKKAKVITLGKEKFK